MSTINLCCLCLAILILSGVLTSVILRLNKVVRMLNVLTLIIRSQKRDDLINSTDTILSNMGFTENK